MLGMYTVPASSLVEAKTVCSRLDMEKEAVHLYLEPWVLVPWAYVESQYSHCNSMLLVSLQLAGFGYLEYVCVQRSEIPSEASWQHHTVILIAHETCYRDSIRYWGLDLVVWVLGRRTHAWQALVARWLSVELTIPAACVHTVVAEVEDVLVSARFLVVK